MLSNLLESSLELLNLSNGELKWTRGVVNIVERCMERKFDCKGSLSNNDLL
jgi:hypothetical protein